MHSLWVKFVLIFKFLYASPNSVMQSMYPCWMNQSMKTMEGRIMLVWPLFVIEIHGIWKGGRVGYFLSPILSQPSFFCFVPQEADRSGYISCSSVICSLLAIGKLCRDHGGRTAQSTSFLLPDGLGFSVLVMAESVNNYHIHLAAPLPWLPQQHHHCPTSSQTCDDRTSAITSLCVPRPSTLVSLLLPTLLWIVSSLNHLHKVLIPARTLTEKE